MGLFSSFTKGLGSIMNPTSLFDLGDSGNAALDYLDPGNTFHQGNADRLANQQFAMEYDIAKKNYEHTIEAYKYQKSLNEQQRQDNLHAVENRVADLKAAGLSPTLAAGSAASVTPVHAGSAPQMVAPTDTKVQAAMFREQMEKDYMQLAMGMMSNMADISRTKAETELIAAQKDKLVGETPIDLRLKEIAQEYAESTNAFKIRQEELNMDYQELKNANEELSKRILENEVNIKAYEAVIKSWEAFYADRKEKSKTEGLETDVKQKTVALQMAEFLHSKEKEAGVPLQMMSPKTKEYWSWYWSSEAQHKKPKVTKPETYNHPINKVLRKLAPYGWKSPSLLFSEHGASRSF